MTSTNEALRNVCIIAHVDHGKTTLAGEMLRQTGALARSEIGRERILDRDALERERGLTIHSKNIALRFQGVKINLVDTPGHSDFGGEVERILSLADGALLLVDSAEGPMPQTRFVLQKALQRGLAPLVVINKMDRPDQRAREVVEEVSDLFLELAALEEQLDFPILYACGRLGWASREIDRAGEDLTPLFEAILRHVPAPRANLDHPARMQVTSLDHSDYVGRIGVGRVIDGILRADEPVVHHRASGQPEIRRIAALWSFEGLGRVPVLEARAGDICAVEGIEDVDIGDTIASLEAQGPLERIHVDEPVLSMLFLVNTSPFAGREGRFLTSRQLRERLHREARANIAIRVEDQKEMDSQSAEAHWAKAGAFLVCGRGVLQLGILVENMRREGYEFAVSRPRVIYREEGGRRLEPFEDVFIEVPDELAGKVIELIGPRRGVLRTMESRRGRTHLTWRVPSRGLIGLRTRLLTATAGECIFYHTLSGYEPDTGPMPRRNAGVLVASHTGRVTAYALDALRDRGAMFVRPGDEVYEGMIVGEHGKGDDIAVNVCRTRKLTNVRAAAADRNIPLPAPKAISLEEALESIADDELVEITPAAFRLRKRHLREAERRKIARAEL